MSRAGQPRSSVANEAAGFISYLKAKKPIDDRALNARVWQGMQETLRQRDRRRTLRVLELGCGIGTMLERALERGLFAQGHSRYARKAAAQVRQPARKSPAAAGRGPVRLRTRVEYTGVDASAGLISEAHRRLSGWSARLGFAAQPAEADSLERDGLHVLVRWVTADAFDHAADPTLLGAHDLLLAHAFLDLVDARRAAQAFLPLLRPGGLFYFSLLFDGVTHFEPGFDPGLDARIERLYHQTMDERTADGRPSGSSRTGRVLLRLLPEAGGQLLQAGSSDWVIFPRGRAYLPEEALLLQHILATVEKALRGHPELAPRDLQRWMECRLAQLERRELCYLAHQIDLFGSYLPPGLPPRGKPC